MEPLEQSEDQVRIERPFPAAFVPRIWKWMEPFKHKLLDDTGPQTIHEFMDKWDVESRGAVTWAVFRGHDGEWECGGIIMSRPTAPGVADIHLVFKQEFWGSKTTIPALSLACKEIFGSGIRKITTYVFADNQPVMHMVRTIGGRKEGTLKAHAIRGGEPVDMFLVSLLKEDFKENGIHVQRRVLEQQGDKSTEQHHGNGHQPAAAGNDLDGAKPDAVSELPDKPAVQLHAGSPQGPHESAGADLVSHP